ncbi:MAG TPA: hypothetical protein EYG92_01935 [Lutibacter sp.]|nr:hypothetical protein [Lutibacter sp.]
MKHLFSHTLLSLSILIFITSCQEKTSELSVNFSCENTTILKNLESVKDFKNNFTIKTPKHWNTKLYYDNTQSEIFSADTIKSLSDTYIMDYSVISNTININEELQKKVKQKTQDNAMETIKESFHKFKEFDAFANLSKGTSRGMDLHVFQYYVKLNEEKYLLIKTEFYGDNDFDSRFCESISLINKIKIHKNN